MAMLLPQPNANAGKLLDLVKIANDQHYDVEFGPRLVLRFSDGLLPGMSTEVGPPSSS